MCGINGIFDYAGRSANLRVELTKVRDQMIQRGPDDSGIWISEEGSIGLAHRRLSIIDLSKSASQPMNIMDGRFHIVFNGEIYNYRELRTELEASGIRFKSDSDTEVLLHLYYLLGEDVVKRLRGMFAFAIWDSLKKELFLARDPYGIKPLYFVNQNGVFRFASQVKALLAGRGFDTQLDPAGVTGFLLWGSVPEPFTLYQSIRSLPAGSLLKVTQNGVHANRSYWNIAHAIQRSEVVAEAIPKGEELEYVVEAIEDSVRSHMVADVPVGAFLSAGLDSNTIVRMASKFSPSSMKSFTLVFDDFVGTASDEGPIAMQTAKQLGLEHYSKTISLQNFEDEFPAFLAAMDQPSIDGLNTWFVSKAARETGLKVVLSGLGGDELFGGYGTFAQIPRTVNTFSWARRIPMLPSAFKHAYRLMAAPWQRPPYSGLGPKTAEVLIYGRSFQKAYQLHRGVFLPSEVEKLIDRDFAKKGLALLAQQELENGYNEFETLSPFGKVAALEATQYMKNQLLRDSDWIGMAHSLEIRVPLVDHVLTEKVIGLASSGRLGENKQVLERYLAGMISPESMRRPKTGFTVPTWRWLRNSNNLQAWKQIKSLRRPNVRNLNLLTYSILWNIPDTRSLLTS